MSISVNKDLCIGCGACVSLCPNVFELNSEGKSDTKGDDEDCAKQAAESCPVQAIEVR